VGLLRRGTVADKSLLARVTRGEGELAEPVRQLRVGVPDLAGAAPDVGAVVSVQLGGVQEVREPRDDRARGTDAPGDVALGAEVPGGEEKQDDHRDGDEC
jgi:hypothetical protein